MSAEGLQTAEPLRMSAGSTREIAFPEFTLPAPVDQLPAGTAPVKASLRWTRTWMPAADAAASPVSCVMIEGVLTVCRTDDRKAEWQYVSEVGVEAAANVEKAPSIMLPVADNMKAVIATVPSKGRLGIGVQLTAGGRPLTDARKDGKPVQVKAAVADASGAEIASKVGTLADFGFS